MQKVTPNVMKTMLDNLDKHSDLEIYRFVLGSFNYLDNYVNEQTAKSVKKNILLKTLSAMQDPYLKSYLIISYLYCNPISLDDYDEFPKYDWININRVLENNTNKERTIIYNRMFANLKFNEVKKTLDIPKNLEFGVEIETSDPELFTLRTLFDEEKVFDILTSLGTPEYISEFVSSKYTFEDDKKYDKWLITKEGDEDYPEVSSPIMTDSLSDYNQIEAMCVFLKALGATTNERTGLHINIGADYFEGNEEALKNLLIIWAECEDLFYKIANEEGSIPRVLTSVSAKPIKGNIQETFKEKPNIKLDTSEDFINFIYDIQVRDELKEILLEKYIDLEMELLKAESTLQKFGIFKKYLNEINEKNPNIKYTSINFTNMNWNGENRGRIEFRIFNSTLSTKTILENILLIGKLCEVSLKMAKLKEYKQVEYNALLRHDVNEEQKLIALLNLLFDTKEQKEIFYSRWLSVHKNNCFSKYTRGTNTYQTYPSISKILKP